jgi:hypothetical protein
MLTIKDTEAILHHALRDAGVLLPTTAEDVERLESLLEECDCCGDVVGLSEAEVTGTQVLCRKCKATR